ncbi:MAG: DnaA regulatory inactivator Hda [Methylohalobius crimeensis]
MLPQLPLQLAFTDQQSFAQYHAGANLETVAALKRCARGEGEPYLCLWGEHGTGKSHLLQASCREAHGLGKRAAYLPLKALQDHPPSLLEGLEHADLVCVDDIETLAGRELWEQAFFHGFNRMREAGTRLIVAGHMPPAQIPVRLPDLRTRLGWGLILRLKPLSDADKLAALRLRAHHLGLELNPQVGQFLLTRYPRDLPSLWRLLEQLDRATLAAKRKLTIPFLKQYLEEHSCEP